MKHFVLSIAISIITSISSYGQQFIWGKSFFSLYEGGAMSNSIASGNEGSIFTCGTYDTELDLDGYKLTSPSGYGGFIVKLDSGGSVQWAKTQSASVYCGLHSVKVDGEGNIFTCGGFEGSLFLENDTIAGTGIINGVLEKYNSEGELLWLRTFPYRAERLELDSDGNVYQLGSEVGPVYKTILSKFNGNGNHIFTDTLCSDGNFVSANFVVDRFKNIFVSGFAGVETDIGGVHFSGGPHGSFVLIKCDPSGVVQWVKNVDNVPSSGAWYAAQMVCDGMGDIYYSTFADELSLTKFDNEGNIIWKHYDPTIFIGLRGMIVDGNGNLLTTGIYRGNFTLGKANFGGIGQHVYVAQFDRNGECQWALAGENEDNDYGWSLTQDQHSGAIYLSGTLSSIEPSFGEIVLPFPTNRIRVFVLKVAHPVKPIHLDLGEDRELCEGQSLYLDPTGFANYEWQDGSTDPAFLVNEPGIYYVKAFDMGGHLQTDTLNVTVCFESTIPNVITPNGDTYNDFFIIDNLDLSISNTLFVYDRWGKKVFSSSAYQNNWSGSDLSSGTYFYELQNGSDSRVYKGWVQVLK